MRTFTGSVTGGLSARTKLSVWKPDAGIPTGFQAVFPDLG